MYHFEPNRDRYPYNEAMDFLSRGMKYGMLGLYGCFGRGDLPYEARGVLISVYGKHASFLGDLKTMAHVAWAAASMRGAY